MFLSEQRCVISTRKLREFLTSEPFREGKEESDEGGERGENKQLVTSARR